MSQMDPVALLAHSGALLMAEDAEEQKRRLVTHILLGDTAKRRKSSPKRAPFDWDRFEEKRDARRWQRYFRVTKDRFRWLCAHEALQCLRPRRSDGVRLEVQVAITLRYCAGASLMDLSEIFRVDDNSTMYNIIPR